MVGLRLAAVVAPVLALAAPAARLGGAQCDLLGRWDAQQIRTVGARIVQVEVARSIRRRPRYDELDPVAPPRLGLGAVLAAIRAASP